MNAESDVDRLKRGYGLFNQQDFEAAAELFHPDVVIERLGGQEPLVGRAAVVSFSQPDAFEEQRFVIEDVRQNGDKIWVRVRTFARGRGSAIELEQLGFHVWTMRDGLGAHLFVTFDEQEALAAAGLQNEGP